MQPEFAAPQKQIHDRAVRMASGWLLTWLVILVALSCI